MKKMRLTRQASMLFVFITLAIDSIGVGIILPVLPDVVRKFVSGEGSVAQTYGYFVAIYALLQFLSSPFLGRLSDRFGRRPILLLSLFGAGVDYVFMAFAPTLPLLFLGRMISGISGASYTVVSAYIADISDDGNRSKNFGVMGAGFGLGFIIGPALGGLLGSQGLIYPFLAAATFNILNFLFGLFILPESLPRERRRAFDLKALNPLTSLVALTKKPSIALLVVAFVFMQLAAQTHPSMWTLYTETRYGWTTAQVGASLAVVGAMSALSQGMLTGPFVRWLGERKVMMYGCLGEMVSYALFGAAKTGFAMYVILIVSSLFWAAHPAIQSLISREIAADQQGELQGALMSITSLMAIINPLMMTTLFSFTSQPQGAIYVPGSPYFLASAFFLVAWLAMYAWCRRPVKRAAIA